MLTMDIAVQLKQVLASHAKLDKKDKEAKSKGVLKGRYIQQQTESGYGYYEIIRENKDTVIVKYIDILDSVISPVLGKEAKVPKDYAVKNIAFRDHWAKTLAQ
jgi:hypothetical protein